MKLPVTEYELVGLVRRMWTYPERDADPPHASATMRKMTRRIDAHSTRGSRQLVRARSSRVPSTRKNARFRRNRAGRSACMQGLSAMSLPRFEFQDEGENDATAPAEFVLKLPPSYARKLARLQSPSWPTPSAPWTIETAPPAPASVWWRTRTAVVAVVASIAVAILVVAGVGSTLTQSSDGPVGVSKRAPKSLDRFVRASAHQSGLAPHVH